MAIGNETFNHELYSLLKVRGYKPSPLNSQNQRVKASQEADVIEFDFIKDGENYGKVWVSIDDASNVRIYFDDEQAESPSNTTPGTDYDDTWTGLLKHIKQWAQRRQLSFALANKDRLGDDMRQRDYYKMKEKLGEGYHPMGKKASYNDAVPNVKIILQHNRGLEEGEQRYRNVAKIFLENQDGERFLAPTTRPGIARVYARHIAEGGIPNDERWNHIKSICEEYNQMAGFVRATRNKEFNESALSLVQEGANHYGNLRETLSKLAGHRGYHAYFESYTPSLMEDEDDTTINELFVQETMDPRIESVMPILSRLHKKVSETAVPEVDSLAEWADSVINEKLDMDDKKPAKKQEKDADSEKKSIGHGPGPLDRIKVDAEKKRTGKLAKFIGVQEGDVIPFKKKKHDDNDDDDSWLDDDEWNDSIPSEEDFAAEEGVRAFWNKLSLDDNPFAKGSSVHEYWEIGWTHGYNNSLKGKKNKTPANDVNEMDKSSNDYNGWGHSKHEVSNGPDKNAKMMAAKDAVKIARKTLDKAFKGDVDENFIGMAPQAVAEVEELDEISRDTAQAVRDITFKNITGLKGQQGRQEVYDKNVRRHTMAYNKLMGKAKVPATNNEVEEGLDANQKRVGQLGPTEKVKNNNIGKLVGANESTEIPEELARIMEMARFKR